MIEINRSLKIVDSNILIDFLLATKDEDLLDLVFIDPVYINLTIFTETINFIQNKISFRDAFDSAGIIVENPDLFLFLPTTPEDLKLATIINKKYYNSKIGFSDSIILAQAENYSLTILTQDERMQIYPNSSVKNPFI